MAAVRIVFSEVSVKEFRAGFSCCGVTGLHDKLMLLLRADQQGGGEGGKTVPVGVFGCFEEPHLEAVVAPVAFVPDDPAKILNEIVPLFDKQGQVCLLRQRLHAFKTLLVFLVGVDIRVIPVSTGFVPLLPPVLYRISGAVRAANVNQD